MKNRLSSGSLQQKLTLLLLALTLLGPIGWDETLFSDQPSAVPVSSQSKKKVRKGKTWWSLRALERPALPATPKDFPSPQNFLDSFVFEKLNEKNLKPSSLATPEQLLRRVYFDLIGLPPSEEELDAFLKDPTFEAYQQVVDRLLASPQYGERWARHWLDLVRFGESHGFEYNQPRNNAWPYRNWVIKAFNEDMPYDDFTRYQLAGDLLAPNDPDGVVAAAFLVAGPHNTTRPSNDKMRKTMLQDEMEDLVGTVGQGFLGLTIHCGRCHDHKFDPISQKDYYSVVSALAGVRPGDRSIPDPGQKGREAQKDIYRRQIDTANKEIQEIESKVREELLSKKKKDKPSPKTLKVPTPFLHWDFTESLKDSLYGLEVQLRNGAKRDSKGLHLDGRAAYGVSGKLPEDLGEKTLMTWVKLAHLNHRGGSSITIQTLGGNLFDAIVFGERSPKRWMAGSNSFRRTQSFGGPEESNAGGLVHMAIVYKADGTIQAYRNGVPYGKPYKTGVQRFKKNEAEFLFGLRHASVGGGKMLAGTVLKASVFNRALTQKEVAASSGKAVWFVSHPELLAALSLEQKNHIQGLKEKIKSWEASLKSIKDVQQAKVFSVRPTNPGETRVLLRGDVYSPADVVKPGGVQALVTLKSDFGLPANAQERDRRLALSQWVSSEKNPLFSRVIVNRIWLYHFGAGIVNTPSDFGANGTSPSHPKLLEALALELREQDYSLKALHRLILTSYTYRQSSLPSAKASAIDADNRLLWRMSPKRLEAEAIRDSLIYISNKMNFELGGQGYRDMRHYGHKGSNFYDPIEVDGKNGYRRTIYRFSPRGAKKTILETFDCPDPSAATPQRAVTTTPLQALALLNNGFMLKMAEDLAELLKRSSGESVERGVQKAYRLLYSRLPDHEEVELAKSFIQKNDWVAYTRVLINTNELLYVR